MNIVICETVTQKSLLFFLAQMLKEKTSIMNKIFENNIFT